MRATFIKSFILLITLATAHCASASLDDGDVVESARGGDVDTAAVTIGTGTPTTTTTTADKKKDGGATQQNYLIVKLEDVYVSN